MWSKGASGPRLSQKEQGERHQKGFAEGDHRWCRLRRVWTRRRANDDDLDKRGFHRGEKQVYVMPKDYWESSDESGRWRERPPSWVAQCRFAERISDGMARWQWGDQSHRLTPLPQSVQGCHQVSPFEVSALCSQRSGNPKRRNCWRRSEVQLLGRWKAICEVFYFESCNRSRNSFLRFVSFCFAQTWLVGSPGWCSFELFERW